MSCYNLSEDFERGSDMMSNKKLNYWVYMARFLSGFLNAGMLLSVGSMLTLHTGNLTRASMYLVNQDWELVILPVVAIVSYFLGCLVTGAYYGQLTEKMSYKYWHGYVTVAVLIALLWIPALREVAIVPILSFSMGIICSMALDNNGYIGTITMMTGLMTSLAKELSYWLFRKQIASKDQVIYLSINLVSYIVGVFVQMFIYLWQGQILPWTIVLLVSFLAFWAYRYGER